VEHALALFDKVVDCWYKYLLGTGDEGMGMSEAQLQEVGEHPQRLWWHGVVPRYTLSKFHVCFDGCSCTVQARGMLQFVADRREKFLGERHIATGEVQYTLALLLIGMNTEPETSLSFVKNALSIYQEQLVRARLRLVWAPHTMHACTHAHVRSLLFCLYVRSFVRSFVVRPQGDDHPSTKDVLKTFEHLAAAVPVAHTGEAE